MTSAPCASLRPFRSAAGGDRWGDDLLKTLAPRGESHVDALFDALVYVGQEDL